MAGPPVHQLGSSLLVDDEPNDAMKGRLSVRIIKETQGL